MQLTVDRIENDMVVCETSQQEILVLPAEHFGFPVKDGDIVEYDGSRAVFLEDVTYDRKAQLQNRFFALLKK